MDWTRPWAGHREADKERNRKRNADLAMTSRPAEPRPACVVAFALVILFAVLFGTPARAEDPVEPVAPRLDPRRYELAGFPIVGGNSDIGIQFGGAATWTRFYDDAHPYLW